MKKCINLLMVILILASIAVATIPYNAMADKKDDDFSNLVGIKQSIDNNIDITYTGNHWVDSKGKTQYEYIARINSAPIYNDDGTAVDCQWYGSGNSYYIKDNVFDVVVTDTLTQVTYQGQTSSWNPIVMIDNKQYKAKGSPNVINDPNNENYTGNILEWDYVVCKRQLRVIEGLIQDNWIFASDPKGTVWIKDNVTKSKDFEWAIAPYAYDANGNSIVINQYKQVMASDMAKATYPVTIDPTTSFVTSASNRTYRSNDNTYDTAWNRSSQAPLGIGNYLDVGQTHITGFGGYSIRRSVVYFDTSGIMSAANITEASLFLRVSVTTTPAVNFSVTIQSGMPTYPHDPAEDGDFYRTNYSGDGGSLNTSVGGLVKDAWNEIALNATGMGWINEDGDTKFMLRSNRDIAGTAPATDTTQLASYWEYDKGVGYRPYLEVTYTASAVPTVTTNAVTYITKSTARLNGYLNADMGGLCNVSFRYALWNGSAWGSNASTTIQTDKTTGNSFYADLTGLNSSSTYRGLALATNDIGTGYGAWLNFTTLDSFYAPTNLSCEATGTNILLSWIKYDSSQVYIRYKVGSYPTGTTDGNAIANQSANSYLHTGLTSGISYYYKVWGLDGGELSVTNATTICTTTAEYTSGSVDALPTTDTSGWNETPNGSVLENNPLYGLGNLEADALGVPYATWWMLVAMGILVITGIVIYTRTRNALATMIGMIIFGVIMAQMGLFPIWVMYIFGMTGIGLSWKELR